MISITTNVLVNPQDLAFSEKNAKPIYCEKMFAIALIASSALLLSSAFYSNYRTGFRNNSLLQTLPTLLKCPKEELICNKTNLQSALNYLCVPGSHTTDSVVVGSRNAELDEISAMMKIEPALKSFEDALYLSLDEFALPYDCKIIADDLAGEMFSNYLNKYRHCGLNETNAVLFSNQLSEDKIKGTMYLQTIEDQWNTWRVFAVARTHRLGLTGYVPPKIIALHELRHIEETTKLAHRTHQVGDELLATLTSVMQIDEILKICKKISLSDEVDYKINLKFDHISIAIGKIANCYRSLNNDSGNLMSAVLSQKSINFIKTGMC